MSRTVAVLALVLAACAPSTQITFELSTDVPCQEIESVGLSVGPVGSVENKAPVATTTSCSPSGTISAIGTYAVVPAAGPVEVSVRVTLAEKGVSLETECTAQNKYKGCIVARRDITFIPRRGLVVPINLLLICRDVACDVSTTCGKLGRCVSSKIDPNKCNGDLCEETVDPFPTGTPDTLAASPRQSTWVVSPDRAPADGKATVGLTLTLRDGAGNPVANERVAVIASGANNLWSIPSSTTDDAGVFLARLASTTAEQKTVIVSTADIELQSNVTFTGGALGDGGFGDGGFGDGGFGDGGFGDGGADAGDGGLPSWVQQAYVKSSNPGQADYFATTMALSADGTTLAIGAPSEDSDTRGINPPNPNEAASASGAVYVFRRTGSSWAQEAYIKASNCDSQDLFGGALSLSSDGNTLAVGARGEASNATLVGGNQTNNALVSGAVYVFKRSGTIWAQQAYIKASNTGLFDEFGASVGLAGDGNTLVVGAPREDSSANTVNGNQNDDLASGSGAAYVFSRVGASWQYEAYLKASNSEAGDTFGYSVAISGNGSTVVVGAYKEASGAVGVNGQQNDNTVQSSGAAYVFVRTGTAWAQQAYLKASNTRANSDFGLSVAMSGDGDTVLVGSPRESGNATGVDGEQISTTAPNSGAAYLFQRTGSNWASGSYIKASNTGINDGFGGAIALGFDGSALAIGAKDESSTATGINSPNMGNGSNSTGAAYFFRKVGQTWEQTAYAKASNTNLGDYFGYSVAISGDGLTCVVGADEEDSNAPGIDGNQADNTATASGAAYVFHVE